MSFWLTEGRARSFLKAREAQRIGGRGLAQDPHEKRQRSGHAHARSTHRHRLPRAGQRVLHGFGQDDTPLRIAPNCESCEPDRAHEVSVHSSCLPGTCRLSR